MSTKDSGLKAIVNENAVSVAFIVLVYLQEKCYCGNFLATNPGLK